MKKHKLINVFSVIILVLFMGLFLSAIVNEQRNNEVSYFSSFIILLTSFAGLRISDGIDDEIRLVRRNYLEMIAVVIGALLTYVFSTDLKFGPVLAASFLGVAVSLVLNRLKNEKLSIPFYCGTFVGMSSSLILESFFQVMFAGLIAGFVFVICGNSFKGVGGKLGTIAFVGVATTVFIIRFLN